MTLDEWKAQQDPMILETAQKWLKQFDFENESVPLQIEVDDLTKAREKFEAAGWIFQRRARKEKP